MLRATVFREVGEPRVRFIVSMLAANTAFLTTFLACVPPITIALPSSTLSASLTVVDPLLLGFVAVRESLSCAAVLRFLLCISP